MKRKKNILFWGVVIMAPFGFILLTKYLAIFFIKIIRTTERESSVMKMRRKGNGRGRKMPHIELIKKNAKIEDKNEESEKKEEKKK